MARRARPVVDESTQHVNRNLAIGAAVLAVGVVGVWAIRGHDEAARSFDVAASASAVYGAAWVSGGFPAAPAANTASAATVVVDESTIEFRNYVAGKYRYLFNDATGTSQDQGALRAALLERERVAVAINTARQSGDAAQRATLAALLSDLAVLDRKVGALLPPAQLTAYDVLKDSDIEQFQLDDYAGGIANVAPLSEADKQSILYTKLVYRQRFRQVLADSGLMGDTLSAAERRVVFADVSRALRDYQTSYLQEVRQYLYNDEQYTLLANYENSEYRGELEKLTTRVE